MCVSGMCEWCVYMVCGVCEQCVYGVGMCVYVYDVCVWHVSVCVCGINACGVCVCVCPIVPRPLSFLQSHHFPVASIPHIPSLMRLWTCHVLGKRITILERTAYALEETCR